MTDKEKSKPVHKIRAGMLELAIWKNDGEEDPWFSVTASRSYKQGDEWLERFLKRLTGPRRRSLAPDRDLWDDWIDGP